MSRKTRCTIGILAATVMGFLFFWLVVLPLIVERLDLAAEFMSDSASYEAKKSILFAYILSGAIPFALLAIWNIVWLGKFDRYHSCDATYNRQYTLQKGINVAVVVVGVLVISITSAGNYTQYLQNPTPTKELYFFFKDSQFYLPIGIWAGVALVLVWLHLSWFTPSVRASFFRKHIVKK
jgi:hypothetical protein